MKKEKKRESRNILMMTCLRIVWEESYWS